MVKSAAKSWLSQDPKTRDLIYTADCGCVIRFFRAAEWRSSHMDPGDWCRQHTGRDQGFARDRLLGEAQSNRDAWVDDLLKTIEGN